MGEQNAESNPQAVQEEEFELTPEIVEYENRRNDLILAAGVMLFTFFLGSFTDASPNLWLHLKSGEWISKNFPNLAQPDPFSYTASDTTWINPNWLFDWTIFQLYARFGDVVVVVIKALVGAVAAGFLLGIRYSGPTQWWTNLCVLTAMVAISVQLALTPQIVSLALFAILLWICFQARYRRRTSVLYFAVPLAILWANLDVTYAMAAFFLFLLAVSESIQLLLPAEWNFDDKKPSAGYVVQTYIVAGLSLAAGIVTPYGLRTLVFPYEWVTGVLPQIAEFELRAGGWSSLNITAFVDLFVAGQLPYSQYAWAALVIATVGSFFLNYSNLQVSRVLLSIASVALGVTFARFVGHSSLLLATVLALNCQEFYLQNWGTEIRISRGWLLWSQLGRAATIILIAFAILGSFTGWVQGTVGRFGYGFANDQFILEANQWLSEANLKGKPFPFFQEPAAFLAYAKPERSTFFDGRWHLFAKSADGDQTVVQKFRDARNAIANKEPEKWKPIFDEYGITHVVVNHALNPQAAKATMGLFESEDWAPLLVSDTALIFGRTDENVDKELVAKLQIDANQKVFHTSTPLPRSTRYVEKPGIIDRIWRTRFEVPPHFVSGIIYSDIPTFEQPGGQYLAIRELRNAIAANPDNPASHFQLALAYQNLYQQEATPFAMEQRDLLLENLKQQQAAEQGQTPSAEPASPAPADQQAKQPPAPVPGEPKSNGESGQAANLATNPTQALAGADPGQVPPATGEINPDSVPAVIPPTSLFLRVRHNQIMASLQNAVTAGGTQPNLHQALGMFASQNQMYDLALHHFELAYAALPESLKEQLEPQLTQLQVEVEQRRARYDETVARMEEGFEQAGANSDVPLERAKWAEYFQLPMLAADELDNISPIGPEMDQAAPFAAALYLRLGRVQDAFDALNRMENSAAKQTLAPGEWDWSMAQVMILLGQYDEARSSLERAIASVRFARTQRTLALAESRVRHGDLFQTLQQSRDTFGDIEREAAFLFNLGLLRLEMGEPHLAPEAFEKALELFPRMENRSVIGFYWPLLTGEELPKGPEPYDVSQEIAQLRDSEARQQEKAPAADAPKEKPQANEEGKENAPKAEQPMPPAQPSAASKEQAAPAEKAAEKEQPKAEPKSEPKEAPKADPNAEAEPKEQPKAEPDGENSESKADPKDE